MIEYCPLCRAKLDPVPRARIQECPQCKRIWFDLNELEVQAAGTQGASAPVRAVVVYEWQVRRSTVAGS